MKLNSPFCKIPIYNKVCDMKQNITKYLGLQLMALALLPASSSIVHAQSPVAQEPVVVDTPFVHDPVMACENGTYYLYCTGHGITQMTSTDCKHWTIVPQGVLKNSEIPAWTHDSVPGFTTHIWAPDVIRFKNKWYLAYSCSTFGKNTSAIGLLSNTSLSDKDGWKDEGCLVASKGDRDNWNAIDPNFIVDEKGTPWLTWGSFWDGIQMIKLDKKTMHVKKGAKPQTIARRHAVGDASAEPNPTSKFAGTNAIEAPFIMKHGGYYYLFVSWDYCCRGIKSNYRVAVGRPAYNVNIKIFNDLQHTITGWPGGKPNADDTYRPERAKPFPKRVVIFSPHPDDDVISMGGTLRRLVQQGHEVHVAYETSGNIAVGDEEVVRFMHFINGFNQLFDDKEGRRYGYTRHPDH